MTSALEDPQERELPDIGYPRVLRNHGSFASGITVVTNADDHVIVLGRMVGGGGDTAKFPLGYWRGSYVRLFRMTAARRG